MNVLLLEATISFSIYPNRKHPSEVKKKHLSF